MPTSQLRIAMLCSGGLGFDTLKKVTQTRDVVAVLTDAKSTSIHSHCEQHKIPLFVGNPRNGKGYGFLQSIQVDVLASVNYLFLIEQDLIDHASRLAFNIHGSLLPRYRGRTPHVWAIINNETEVGITAHKIVAECDAGDILQQVRIPLSDQDTGATVLEKYAVKYHPLFEQVLARAELGQLEGEPQDERFATWFGIRTPDDGEINWDWCRERIRNWIRAQAAPYPGSFSFYNGQKVTIDGASYSPLGFTQSTPNGTILVSTDSVIVKTPNGALKLESIREKIRFEVGNRLG